MAPKKVALAEVRTLTFKDGAKTRARRTAPIAQLTCVGTPCKLYKPKVVRCYNEGGEEDEIDWRVRAAHFRCMNGP